MPQFFTLYLSEVRRLTAQRRFANTGGLYSLVFKRLLDFGFAIMLLAPVGALLGLLSVYLLLVQGRPIFFVSERMGQAGRPFQLLKLRTMAVDPGDAGVATGGDKAARVTRVGGWLRAWRLDELPQLWNILRGELSFVGPRPPLRRYVERHPEVYAQVLRSRPGLTGLATVVFRDAEARILAHAQSQHDTDLLYSARCVPRKARIDLIHQHNVCVSLDLMILYKTLRRR